MERIQKIKLAFIADLLYENWSDPTTGEDGWSFWREIEGGAQKLYCWEESWDPANNPEQCAMVDEGMRKKGYWLIVKRLDDGVMAYYYHKDANKIGMNSAKIWADTEWEARCLAALAVIGDQYGS